MKRCKKQRKNADSSKFRKVEKLSSLVEAVKSKSRVEEIQKIINLGGDLEEKSEDKTALMYAVINGDVEVAKLLLKAGADVTTKDADNNTVLMLAVLHTRHSDFIENLLSKNRENVNSKNNADATALLIACENGDLAIVQTLLNHNASLGDQNEEEDTPLMVATRNGHLEIMKTLIEAGAAIEAINKEGKTAVFQIKNEETLKVLLQAGCNPLAVRKDKTPVIASIIRSDNRNILGCVKLLLDAGANPLSTNTNGDSILKIIIRECSLQDNALHTFDYLLKNTSVNPSHMSESRLGALACTIVSCRLDVTTLLLKAGAIPASRDFYLFSLIPEDHIEGYIDILKVFIQSGVDVNSQDAFGKNVLMSAAKNHNINFVKILLQYGANPSQQDEEGNSAVSEVLKLETPKYLELINIVLKASVNYPAPVQNLNDKISSIIFAMNSKDDDLLEDFLNHSEFIKDYHGKNILMKACELKEENVKLVKLLIKKYSILSAQDNDGKTALMLAFENYNFKSLKLLIKAGANISRQDNTGTSLFMMACKSGNLEIVKLLLHEVFSLIHNYEGETAAMLAASENHLNVLCYLLRHGACSCVHQDKEGNSVLSYVVKNRLDNDIPVRPEFEKTLRFIVEYGTPFDNVAIVYEVVRVYLKYYKEGNHELLLPFYKDFTQKIVDKASTMITNSTILIQHQLRIHQLLMHPDFIGLSGCFKYRCEIFYIIIKSVFKHVTLTDNHYTYGIPYYGMVDEIFMLETNAMGYLIDLCHARDDHYKITEESYVFYYTLIENMIENGFPINPVDPYTTSPLSVLVGLNNDNDYEKEKQIFKLMNDLIKFGANKCQFSVEFQDPDVELLRENLQLSDSLLLAIKSGYSSVLPVLARYWSAPPLALLLFLSPLEHYSPADDCIEALEDLVLSLKNCLNVLSEICGPLPPGYEYIQTIQRKLDELGDHYEPARGLALQFRTLHTVGPPSLQNLCRYVVRGCAPARAGDDLPDLIASRASRLPNALINFVTLMAGNNHSELT